MYKHILIATDGSDVGEKGVEHGLALAKSLGARATLVTVTEPFPITGGEFAYVPSQETVESFETGQRERANARLAAVKAAADQAGVQIETLHVADAQPAEAILAAAKSHDCDLIVMGSHGRRGIGRLMLGSKTYEVVSHGHIPVLVVR
ncbi:universal stress protein [Novosphingobium album (ex Liu et al. 2023)]|uniref:Universal stress protein n=1 Tax=Novosphingobium album (ex Liu et al. 2023) TaxID=3031130 RepID=A0ABT5WRZ7_9SPHN|nr:universal stress protein [Novosphingobium album (ex Liu et al. 2023)]MDE8652819.1 universal stress protein [Novosphingobium album (ex Liu et al. 2023)]